MSIQLQGCLKSIRIISIVWISVFQTEGLLSQPVFRKSTRQIAAKPANVNRAKAPISSISVFDTEQGLASSSVLTSLKDSKGNLWFGTLGGGVSRYDGRSFQTFNATHGLANNIVMTVLEDRKGDLWVRTNIGVRWESPPKSPIATSGKATILLKFGRKVPMESGIILLHIASLFSHPGGGTHGCISSTAYFFCLPLVS